MRSQPKGPTCLRRNDLLSLPCSSLSTLSGCQCFDCARKALSDNPMSRLLQPGHGAIGQSAYTQCTLLAEQWHPSTTDLGYHYVLGSTGGGCKLAFTLLVHSGVRLIILVGGLSVVSNLEAAGNAPQHEVRPYHEVK